MTYHVTTHLHGGEEDALVVLVVVTELAQRLHRLQSVLREHVVEARNERSLTHALCDVIVQVGRRRTRQRRQASLERRPQWQQVKVNAVKAKRIVFVKAR